MKALIPKLSANNANAAVMAVLITRMMRVVASPLSTTRCWIAGATKSPTTLTMTRSATPSPTFCMVGKGSEPVLEDAAQLESQQHLSAEHQHACLVEGDLDLFDRIHAVKNAWF